jgi:hypothetical protein
MSTNYHNVEGIIGGVVFLTIVVLSKIIFKTFKKYDLLLRGTSGYGIYDNIKS